MRRTRHHRDHQHPGRYEGTEIDDPANQTGEPVSSDNIATYTGFCRQSRSMQSTHSRLDDLLGTISAWS